MLGRMRLFGPRRGRLATHAHMPQEAADELVSIERHHPVSRRIFESVILPLKVTPLSLSAFHF
jgi:hypothetical protein